MQANFLHSLGLSSLVILIHALILVGKTLRTHAAPSRSIDVEGLEFPVCAWNFCSVREDSLCFWFRVETSTLNDARRFQKRKKLNKKGP